MTERSLAQLFLAKLPTFLESVSTVTSFTTMIDIGCFGPSLECSDLPSHFYL